MTIRPIRFFHRGQIVEVDDAAPTRSVLDWLREDARCTGTKEGCNEGDCGACTVVLGTLAAPGETNAIRGLKLETVNACLQFMPTLDGKALFTVEDLKAMTPDAALHPVQQAMVECHGSQCGFCTPGFVMSLWAGYERHRACGSTPTRRALADDLSGNLCRCTGYRPILDAGQRMFELPAVALDTTPVVAALKTIASGDTFQYGDRFFAPRTLEDLAALRLAVPDARLLAGATDIGLWVNKQFRDLGEILYLGGVAELRTIEERDGSLRIGAGASLEDAWRVLVQRWPSLTDVWLRFASPPVRHAGTMGGNLANGSPIGDSAPILMALDAQIELRRGHHIRCMPLPDFYVDYMKNRLEPGEFVKAIVVPLASAERQVRGYKISKRFDCDISAICAGFAIELDGEVVRSVHLAFGGMAAIVKRAAHAEAALLGQPWNEASLRAAQAALAQDFKPLTDLRASAEHRMRVAANLLRRFWLETRLHDPLPAEALNVFASLAHEAA
ncbi:xanthine dehydrogenase small subunit [Piscinibacter aquaticus]|uniref:Xanthine dehydrogenase small subunit n=1 Tax=Piscinibacter aquaticus TaxID=392597 RepID=A0A5C6U1I6_9BURK|nr:xanthine dehydrogenase small subunit [Piscinibacter aquaticus]